MSANVEGVLAVKEEGTYTGHPAWVRLEDQLRWYSRNSQMKQFVYKSIKLVQIILAASIPLVALVEHAAARWVAAGFGACIAILEGAQQLGQYQFLWITYRSTAEHLKHERALFLASAGPYRDLPIGERLVLLSERVEERVSTEHANWFNESHKSGSREQQPKRRQ